jgi:putative thioredoxin
LLEIVRLDRTWNDAAGRKQLLKIFDVLGAADPLTQDARRRLSAVLFS